MISYLNIDDKTETISIKDFLLLLPSSLANLAKSFDEEDKGLFPYIFPNSYNLSYIGKVPTYYGIRVIRVELTISSWKEDDITT